MDNLYDLMIYDCVYCGHVWKFLSNKLGTDKQVEEWFTDVQKEHYEVCKIYKTLRDLSKEE